MVGVAEPSAPVVRIRGLTKSFGANQVLKSVDLDIGRGEVRGTRSAVDCPRADTPAAAAIAHIAPIAHRRGIVNPVSREADTD